MAAMPESTASAPAAAIIAAVFFGNGGADGAFRVLRLWPGCRSFPLNFSGLSIRIY